MNDEKWAKKVHTKVVKFIQTGKIWSLN
jgi:hypothetical protein